MIIRCLLMVLLFLTVIPIFADELEDKRGPTEIIENAPADQWRDLDPAQIMVIDLERGRVTVELSDVFAQGHVAQMKVLVKAGYYDGLSFYRVIDGFVAQAGDVFEKRELPEGTVRGLKAEFETSLIPSDYPISLNKDHEGYGGVSAFLNGWPIGLDFEFSTLENHNHSMQDKQDVWALHCTGAMAMARDTPKDTGGTEFYITLQPQRYLDRNLTVFGKVIDGMEHLQALKRQAAPTVEGEALGDIILRAWMGDQAPEGEIARVWQVMHTDTQTFEDYVEARRNRPEAFFYHRSNHLDVCQLPVPVRERP